MTDPTPDDWAWQRALNDDLQRMIRNSVFGSANAKGQASFPPIDLAATKIVGHVHVPAEILADTRFPPPPPRARWWRWIRRDTLRLVALDTAALAVLTIITGAAWAWHTIRRRPR